MPANDRRGTGKSDELDAARIARAVLGLDTQNLRTRRALATDQARVAMRVLVVAREQMTGEKTRAINALIAPVRTIDLGVDARKPLSAAQITTIASWRDRDENATTTTCRHEAIRLARRIRTLDADLASNRADITELTHQDTPQLLAFVGVGAVIAATVLVAWSHPGRVRSDAAMASLAGTSELAPSMGSVGDCYDNSMIETFWSRMQVKLFDPRHWRTRIKLANAIFDYLEIWHNRRRDTAALACSHR